MAVAKARRPHIVIIITVCFAVSFPNNTGDAVEIQGQTQPYMYEPVPQPDAAHEGQAAQLRLNANSRDW